MKFKKITKITVSLIILSIIFTALSTAQKITHNIPYYFTQNEGQWHDEVEFKAELPGVDKKDISVDVKDGILTLSGERTYENEVKEGNYYRKERAFGKFNRSFALPEGLDPEKIDADYKDGVLKIAIPKPEEKKPRKIAVH